MTALILEGLDYEFQPLEDDQYEPSAEDLREYWNGKGHIQFFVSQNATGVFEMEYEDYSGCAGGMQETVGIDYYIQHVWRLHKDPTFKLREGVSYTIHGLTVTWTRGDGWELDDDVEYDFESITVTGTTTVWGYLTHKVKMIWWRQVQCRIKEWREKNHGR